MGEVEDATGKPIFPHDAVMFETTTGGAQHGHGRGLVLKALPDKRMISVLCVDGTEVEKKPCELTVVDRTILRLGMPVMSASDTGGQAGVITGVTTVLDLVDLNDEHTVVATGVSPEEVCTVKELELGDYVVSGTWLGRDNFLPGDRVAGDSSVFKASRWLRGHWKPDRCEGTVAKVGLVGVLVYWVASLHASADPPPAYQPNPRDLTFFCSGDVYRMWFWLVSQRCFFRSQHRRQTKKVRRWRRTRRMRRPPDRRELERPMAVADTRTTVDVLWQDGTRQQGVPSASLLRVLVQNPQDFLPGQRVVSKAVVSRHHNNNNNNNNVPRRVGIVQSLSYKDQTVYVSWITDHQDPAGESSSEVDTTVMSTYDLRRSSDHNFFYGDIVVRQLPRESTGGNTEHTINDLSWVGHIVGLCDTEYIHVKWGDGNTSKVLLGEIALVKPRRIEDMRNEMGDWVHDETMMMPLKTGRKRTSTMAVKLITIL
ncbi:hypothetical protein HU200_057196 [Digitaria exilis]|uniref:Uncharacterized protein n=1 Tax=Digitaria exilis TaxID=1010633 RepID=A0A835AFL0_9POAL|nr:hypothetical protein HU200_057196 [Digitaria exilis]